MTLSNPKGRLNWVDTAKGLAMALMVLAHIIGGLLTLNLLPAPHAFEAFYVWVYTFHMATLMMLAGLFIEGSASKGAKRFVLGRIGSLYYPAILWGGITYLAASTFSAYVNHPRQPSDLLLLLYSPQSAFWFLTTLLGLSLAYIGMRRIGLPIIVIAGIWFAAYLLGERTAQPQISFWGWWGSFLILGVLARSAAPRLAERAPSALLVLVIGLGSWVTVRFPHSGVGTSAIDLFASWSGVSMMLCLAVLLVRQKWLVLVSQILTLLGRRSLEIYALHSLAWVAARAVLIRGMHVKSGIAVMMISWAVGVFVPVAIAELSIKLRVSWIFRLSLQHPLAALPVESRAKSGLSVTA